MRRATTRRRGEEVALRFRPKVCRLGIEAKAAAAVGRAVADPRRERAEPARAVRGAVGTPYMGQLSTAPQDVREYFLALTTEIVERYRPVSVWVEALMRRSFPMPGKRRVEIPQRCRFILSLCFNPASMAYADAEGLEAEPFRRDSRGPAQPANKDRGSCHTTVPRHD